MKKPHNIEPHAAKRLPHAFDEGRVAQAQPRSMREGAELVGWGMASGVWEALEMDMSARIVLTANGETRQITKREAVVAQLVDKSTGADLRATKMLIDMLKDIEKRAGVAPPPEAPQFMPADEEVVENLLTRLRRMEWAKIHHGDTENAEES